MQITLAQPGEPETAEPFTLMLAGMKLRFSELSGVEYEVDPTSVCTFCSTRPPEWFASPASSAAMNPDASPIGAGSVCSPCLNALIENTAVVVLELDPSSF